MHGQVDQGRGEEREEEREQWRHTAAGVGVAEALIASAATLPQFSVEGRTRPEVTDTRQKFGGRHARESGLGKRPRPAGDPRVQADAVLRFVRGEDLAEMESAAESLLGVLRRRWGFMWRGRWTGAMRLKLN